MINIPEVERIKGLVGDRILFHSDTNDYSLLISDVQRLMGIVDRESHPKIVLRRGGQYRCNNGSIFVMDIILENEEGQYLYHSDRFSLGWHKDGTCENNSVHYRICEVISEPAGFIR